MGLRRRAHRPLCRREDAMRATLPRVERRRSGLERKEAVAAYLFLSPWLIGFVVFLLISILLSFYAAFTRWTVINPPPRWIGLGNFVEMFTEDRYFWPSLWITFKFMLITVPLQIVLGLLLALLLNQKLPGMHLFRTIFYIPAVVSGVAV